MYQISIKSSFSAAHNLREYKGKCENLHGHNWNIEVFVESDRLNKEGMVIDFIDLKAILKEALAKLDHNYINEVKPFDSLNPTSENLSWYIFRAMGEALSDNGIRVKRVDVWETESSRASYYE
ncbi:MAG: 6-carboxytetrahydropterin synthase QueD [Candidatus Kaelpia aquatica]|nr:6-carboxytetrahydropterin synthase QueD [Candidatus Kaelpia aquatica]